MVGVEYVPRMFPVQSPWRYKRSPAVKCPREIPWSLVAAHEEQARLNHGGQSLHRLAERHGCPPLEIWAIVNDCRYPHSGTMTEESALEWLVGQISKGLD